ncbi:non-functional NADPH-dependent codeinone reductase 2-like [Magnolia sinica]|uniref:non-functional NADPH-dependent codeinone reductase 2-like n=1 Tax=Magnolia sinica TaxID=86752 RepID=UPI0026596C30|nr:non-functional NADPH-dependent codeinone reductase 2-like [Magnolia sinica]
MGEIPTAVLSSGHTIPLIGMGTATYPVPPQDQLISNFISAMELGYRHFDTAAVYYTEEALGLAIAEAIRRGVVKSREELFITSKLWCNEAHHDRVIPAVKKTLENLGLEYLDLYLIHWPLSLKPGELTFQFKKEDLLAMDFKSVWEAMEECQKLGLTKSIGVSNFSCKKLSDLIAVASIPPAVNQVEMHATWQQQKLREFCKENGIHVTAWSPLGANGATWGTLAIMESPVLKEIADAKGKTVAQVALRWLHEQGVSVVVKSFNKERMKKNIQIFDWELTKDERDQISRVPQRRGFSGELFLSPSGPFKSVEELWDGEV